MGANWIAQGAEMLVSDRARIPRCHMVRESEPSTGLAGWDLFYLSGAGVSRKAYRSNERLWGWRFGAL
jgi:hypothetical protein